MMGFGRVVAFLAPNLAAFMLTRGLTPPQVYMVYGVVLAVAGVAVLLLHRTYRGANTLDAMQLETQLGLDASETAGELAPLASPGRG